MKTRIGIGLVAILVLALGNGCAWLTQPCNCGSAQRAPVTNPHLMEAPQQPS
jgi:hypothetical protein